MQLSTGPQQKHRTFYEFRTYAIRPDKTAAFLQLTNEKIHLRTAHSELIGYWSVEYGGLNQVFHIWKYGEDVVLLVSWVRCFLLLFLSVDLICVAKRLLCSSDSFSQRAAARASLAQDACWVSQYISKAIPMLTSQDNEVTYLLPWSHLQKPPKEGGKPHPLPAKLITCFQ